jgi:DNA-binding GntR family transcriptional regulator
MVKPKLAARAAPRASTTAAIAARITDAMIEHRLPPGAKLGEAALGEIFGVSRTKVRQALIRLAQEKLVTLQPARGAYVAKPDAREARELFDTRRVIERVLIERFTAAASREQLTALRQHVQRETQSIAAGDSATRNRLLGEFHVLIAAMAGNQVMADMLRELVRRSSLATLHFQDSRSAACSSDEHAVLLEAVRRRDAIAAVRLMDEHLAHVERDLTLAGLRGQALDLRAALKV